MIELIRAPGISTVVEGKMTFKHMQAFVGGWVERIEAWQTDGAGQQTTPAERVDLLCNEEGLMLGLELNLMIVRRFGEEWGFSANGHRPVGNWIVLSGKDRLK